MKKNQGFTLVELIVVIGVLALLAVGAMLAFTNVQRNARRSAARSDATRLSEALNTFNSAVRTGQHASVPSGSGGTFTLVVPAQDGLDEMDLSVSFGATRYQDVPGWITSTTTSTGVRFEVNDAAIAAIN